MGVRGRAVGVDGTCVLVGVNGCGEISVGVNSICSCG